MTKGRALEILKKIYITNLNNLKEEVNANKAPNPATVIRLSITLESLYSFLSYFAMRYKKLKDEDEIEKKHAELFNKEDLKDILQEMHETSKKIYQSHIVKETNRIAKDYI